jgi:hypothetical protein
MTVRRTSKTLSLSLSLLARSLTCSLERKHSTAQHSTQAHPRYRTYALTGWHACWMPAHRSGTCQVGFSLWRSHCCCAQSSPSPWWRAATQALVSSKGGRKGGREGGRQGGGRPTRLLPLPRSSSASAQASWQGTGDCCERASGWLRLPLSVNASDNCRERVSREGIRLSVCLLSVYLCGCAVPRIEKADLDHCPELNDKVAWSNQAQCYYKPVAGRSVSWYVTYSTLTQTLTHSRTHE